MIIRPGAKPSCTASSTLRCIRCSVSLSTSPHLRNNVYNMPLERYFTQSTRRSEVPQDPGTETSVSHHSAASQRLARARDISSATSSQSSRDSSPAAPERDPARAGQVVSFNIDWDHIYYRRHKIPSYEIGYTPKFVSVASGRRKGSMIFNHGAELTWRRPNGSTQRFWLCMRCHVRRELGDAYLISTNAHIKQHLRSQHKVELDALAAPAGTSELLPGQRESIAHTPWEEDKLQQAWLDWTIIQDQSFRNAVSPEVRSLLTWNRSQLLASLPKSATTLSDYVVITLASRKQEVRDLLTAAQSDITISCDIWTSPNDYSFLGVVAHFVGKTLYLRLVVIY
jgi:hypothetical protein